MRLRVKAEGDGDVECSVYARSLQNHLDRVKSQASNNCSASSCGGVQ